MLLLALLGAPSTLPAATAATFEVVPPALSGTALLVELRADEGLGEVETVLDAFEARGLSVSIVLPVALAERETERVRALGKRGHELVLRFDAPPPAGSPSAQYEAWRVAGRDQVKAFRRATRSRPQAILVDRLTRASEYALYDLRVRTVLVEQTGRPRRSRGPAGLEGVALVVPHGDGPATTVDAELLDTVAADLASSASGGAAVLRLPLLLSELDEAELDLLTSWIDDIVLPVGVELPTASKLPFRATASLTVTEVATRARPVDLGTVQEAAAELAGATLLPAELPGPLTITEAFLAFSLALAEDELPQRVVLGELGPPPAEAVSSSPAGGYVSAADVRAAAAELAPHLTHAVPGLVDVGELTLTAPEFLLVMAQVLQGASTASFAPVRSPDPFAEDLGWGRSTGR